MSDQNNWDLVSFVKRSDQRKQVLEALEQPSMPNELSETTEIRQSHVSRALKEMKDKSLVKILNPDAKQGRLYRRTEKGDEIMQEIRKVDGKIKQIRDHGPEYDAVAKGAVLEDKLEEKAEEDSKYSSLNQQVKETIQKWKNQEISSEEAIEEYERIEEEFEELQNR